MRLLEYQQADVRGRLSPRPHVGGLAADGLHLRLQPPHPHPVRPQGARRELRLQALPPLGARPLPAAAATAASSTRSSCSARASTDARSSRSASTTSRARAGMSTLASFAVIARDAPRDGRELERPPVVSRPQAAILVAILVVAAVLRAGRPRLGPAPPAPRRRERVRPERAPDDRGGRPRPPVLRVPRACSSTSSIRSCAR